MEGKLYIPIGTLILMGLVLSLMIVGGYASTTRHVELQEAVGPQKAGRPQGPVALQEKVGPQEIIRPQQPSGSQETVGPEASEGPHEFVGQRAGIGPADPIVLVARVLRLVGLATEGG